MTLLLAPHVHAVRVDDDLVFLDLARDAYACLPGLARTAALYPDRRRLAAHDPEAAAELAAAGLVVPPSQAAPPDTEVARVDLPEPTRSAIRDAYPAPTRRDAVAIAHALVGVARGYRGRALRHIVDAAAEGRRRAPRRLNDRLLAACDRFHAWIPYAPVSGKCLLRSFMLLQHLRKTGEDAHWVFGVRTWPFHAHCWLQCEDMVLDDRFERAASYTPILVV